MKQNQIKFKNLKENQIIQIVDLNDYFGDAVPTISKPLTKTEFIKKYLQEIVEEAEVDVNEAFDIEFGNSGDGDSNKVVLTVIDGVAQVVLS